MGLGHWRCAMWTMSNVQALIFIGGGRHCGRTAAEAVGLIVDRERRKPRRNYAKLSTAKAYASWRCSCFAAFRLAMTFRKSLARLP
jgi:hypothetical protein